MTLREEAVWVGADCRNHHGGDDRLKKEKARKESAEPFVGLVGLGYWGRNILRNLHQMGVLCSACDFDAAVLDLYRNQYPELIFTDSYRDLLKDPAVRAVAIASPAETHYELAARALQAGKDVFVEKPLALTVQEGETLVALAEKKGMVLMVGHILQYHPATIGLKRLIADGVLGQIRYVYSNRLNIGKLRTEENILWSFAPHDISVLLSLVGEDPVRVNAFGEGYLNREIYDTTLTTLEFRNGIKGHIFVSWLHPFKEQKLIVVGSKAMAVFDDMSEEKLFLYPHQIEWKDGKFPVAQKADYQVIKIEGGEPLRRELEHFISCIRQGGKPLTSGQEGLRVLRILEAAEKDLLAKSPRVLSPADSAPHRPDRDYFVQETALVDDQVMIGKGSKIWHFSHILSGSSLGEGCNIGQNVVIGPDVTVGNRCKIQNNVSVYKGVTLEDGVFCGPSMVFTNISNPRAEISKMDQVRPTLVKRGTTIGANATLVCGVTIGTYAFIGAGAVVTKDVPDHALCVGNPSKQIGWACQCGERLPKRLACKACGKKYVKGKAGLTEA